jgi:hypothetical protein
MFIKSRILLLVCNNTIVNTSNASCDKNHSSIPHHKQWIITMWHFGRDALTEYSGEKFSKTVEAQHILTRLYVKDFKGKNRIRIERQEYPQKTVVGAIEEKLNIDLSY